MKAYIRTEGKTYEIAQMKEIKPFYMGEPSEPFKVEEFDDFVYFPGYHYIFVGIKTLSIYGDQIESVVFTRE